jgi:hypothetical protein
MNFEERIEALTARHEALAQSLEVIGHMQFENEKAIAKTEENINALAKIAGTALDSIKRLERIAVAHEERIDDLEGGQ